jgi:hypothetical protein
MSRAQCESGRVLDGDCDCLSSAIVEYMPAQHRASHTVAGNHGAYPSNGALRLRVCEACADAMTACEPDWCERVGVLDPEGGFEDGNPRHVSLTPLDVGFDLRAHDTAVQLPRDAEAVRFVGRDGSPVFRRGTWETLAQALRDAGYKVVRQ